MKTIIIILTFFSFSAVSSQTISGKISGVNPANEKMPLPFAKIQWLGSEAGTLSDADGNFSIERNNALQQKIIFSYVGYESDTIEPGTQTYLEVELKSIVFDGVTILSESSPTTINMTGPVSMETLTKKELLKAACCNLSESFETNATVDAEFSDAVTGARTINLLGLDGVYSQIMVENMPNVRGLSSSYGLTFIPGPWIESIQISKGAGSVVNGYESLTGSINTEIKKPFHEEEPFTINLYGSNSGRFEANVTGKLLLNEKWSTALFTHTSQLHNKMDHNQDGFLDAPLNETYAVMNKWNYFSGKTHEAQLGLKYVFSDLTGGQTNFDEGSERTTANGYGVNVHINRFEGFMKNGFVFKRPSTSIGTIVSFSHHDQQAYFGLNNYTGIETYAHVNLIGQTFIFNTNHLFKTGVSFLYDDFNETYDSVSYLRTEQVPGIFLEYSYTKPERWTLLAGVRADEHNLYGTFISPRMHFKWSAVENTTIRLSAGKGFRVANVFAENTSLLTSNREIIFLEELMPEQAWNYGFTFIQAFKIDEREGTFTFDIYRTDFVNQVVVNTDSSVHEIYISNLHGRSFSNALQAEFNYRLFKNFDFRVAYKYIDAKTTYGSELLEVPLTSRHRGLVNLAYKTNNESWLFDFTTQYYGQSRFPDLSENHSAHHLGEYSPAYALLLCQVTKKFKWFDIYAGSENLTNYTQHNPIIGADDPFGENFDASVIYAPTMERKFYAGFRFIFN